MKKIALIIFIVLFLLISSFFYYLNSNTAIIKINDCPVITKEVTVDGTSMFPFINSGDKVTAIYDYYNCHDVLRNDVVLYDYSGNKNLLIKFVKAVPGDTWSLKKVNNEYEIVVNGISLLNHENIPYSLTENSIKMIELYIKDYPVIPENTYLLLGDKTSGSMDSTKFGLVNKKQIMAKVEINK